MVTPFLPSQNLLLQVRLRLTVYDGPVCDIEYVLDVVRYLRIGDVQELQLLFPFGSSLEAEASIMI
jgi:hypothetical protein